MSRKNMKRSLRGLYFIVAFEAGMFFILVNIISRGGWFILLSIFLIIFMLCIAVYIVFILFTLLLLKQPETVVLDENDLKERLKLKKQEGEKRGEGIHIRFGCMKK